MIEEVIPILQTFGFPAAICFYFIIRTEKIINNNTKALTDFKVTIQGCKKN